MADEIIKDITVNLDLETAQADQKYKKTKEKLSEPIQLPLDIDISGLKAALGRVESAIKEIGRAFSKDLNFEKTQKQVESLTNSFNTILVKSKKDPSKNLLRVFGIESLANSINEIKDTFTDFSKMSIKNESLEKLVDSLDQIVKYVSIIQNKVSLDSIRPSKAVQSDLDIVNQKLNDYSKEINEISKLEKKFSKGVGKQFAEDVLRDFVDEEDDGFSKRISELKEFVKLGGDLSSIKIGVRGDLAGKTLKDVYDKLLSKGTIDLINLDNVASAAKVVTELNTQKTMFEEELKNALAKEEQKVGVSLDTTSIEILSSQLSEAMKNISIAVSSLPTNEQINLGISEKDLSSILSGIEKIEVAINTLKDDWLQLKDKNIELLFIPNEESINDAINKVQNRFNQSPIKIEYSPIPSENNIKENENQINNIKVHVEPELDPVLFSDQIQNLLDSEKTFSYVTIPVQPDVDSSASLVDNIKEQLVGKTIPIEIEPVIKDLSEFQTIINNSLNNNENSSISSFIDPSIFDSLITKINKELNPVIQQIGTAFSNEKIAADYAVALEIKDLQELSKEITEIINQINKKSDAFKKEAGVVRHWVPIENEELLILKKTLGDITHYLKELEGLSKIDLGKLKLPKESPKIANAATKADNPMDANKQKGREPVKGLKNTYSKEELNIRTKAVYDEISLTEAKIKEMGGEVTTINTFFDSEENLVKAMVKATRTLEGKIENASYSIGYSFPKYDKSGNMIQEGGAFTSNINSDDYKTIEKRQEKENNNKKKKENEQRKKLYNDEIILRDQAYDKKLKNETKILQLQLDSNKSHENEIQALIEKNKQLKEEISLHQKNAELINEEAAKESKSQKRKEERNVYSSFKDLEESKKNDKAKNELNNISNKYKSLEETFQKIDFSFGPKNKRNLKYIEEVSNEIAVLKEQINSVKESTNNIQLLNEDELKKLLETLEKIEQKEKQIKSYKNNVNYQAADEEIIYKQITDIDKLLAKNDRMSKELKASFQDLKIRFANMINSNKPESELEDLIVEFRKLESEMQEAGNTGVKFTTLISKRIRGMSASFIAQWLSLYDIIRYIRQSASTIIQLDDALVDLSKTTKMSSSELTEFYYNANRLAKEMGVTTAEIINQASAFSRLGFSSKEASEAMAQLSSKFASISPDMDVSTATDGLVSVMKAFGVEVEDVERKILDNINIVGNTAATSNGEIVDMLMRSSAAMKEANNSLEETIALETAAIEITRNAETTGTAFKTNNCLYVQKCA